MIRVGVVGASGRTGSKVVEALDAAQGAVLSAAVVSPSSSRLGARVKGSELLYSCQLEDLKGCDAVIEFSTPETSVAVAERCAELGIPLVVATTGHSAEQLARIEAAAQQVAILVAPNTSLGATILALLVEQAKEASAGAFDLEVMEIHHRMKRDAPSGTARALVQVALSPGQQVVFGREAQRSTGEVGVVALRGGDVPGDHTVYFLGEGERLELTHRVHDRRVFGAGAVALARRLVGRKPGLYSARVLLLGE